MDLEKQRNPSLKYPNTYNTSTLVILGIGENSSFCYILVQLLHWHAKRSPWPLHNNCGTADDVREREMEADSGER